MDDYLWTQNRAELFARGLYHVARCDGLHLKERDAIEAFIERTGITLDVHALDDEPFDYERAAVALESTWLRKVFVASVPNHGSSRWTRHTARTRCSSAMAAAMGIGESSALAQIDDANATPVNLLEWIDALQVDFVSWDDHHQPGYFWEFPHPNRKLAPKAILHVYEGQELVVSYQDRVTDVLTPGSYYATPDNLPGFASQSQWSGDPTHMDLVFLRQSPSPGMRWGLSDGVELKTPDLGEFTLRAYGRCAVRVHDAAMVKTRMTGLGIPTSAEVEQRVGRIVAGRFSKSLIEASETNDDFSKELSDLDALRDRVAPHLREQFKSSGLALSALALKIYPAPNWYSPRSLRAEKLNKIGQQVLSRTTGDSIPDGSNVHLSTSSSSSLSFDASLDETNPSFAPMTDSNHSSAESSVQRACHMCATPLRLDASIVHTVVRLNEFHARNVVPQSSVAPHTAVM